MNESMTRHQDSLLTAILYVLYAQYYSLYCSHAQVKLLRNLFGTIHTLLTCVGSI